MQEAQPSRAGVGCARVEFLQQLDPFATQCLSAVAQLIYEPCPFAVSVEQPGEMFKVADLPAERVGQRAVVRIFISHAFSALDNLAITLQEFLGNHYGCRIALWQHILC